MNETYLVWEGLNSLSLEHCQVLSSSSGHHVNGVIVGTGDKKIFRCHYNIQLNPYWETTFFSIESMLDEATWSVSFNRDKKKRWTYNGHHEPLFDSCIDIDISLTPFTNTLPINRLPFAAGEQQNITVLYLDILQQRALPVQQKYTNTADGTYLFESNAGKFKSLIFVDAKGFVTDYPALFKRKLIKIIS